MIRVILGVLLVIFISFGYGIEINKKFHLNIKGFKGVIGFIVFMALIQAGYYPIQFFNLSFNYIILVSLAVILFGIFLVLKNIKSLIDDILNINTAVVLISVGLFYLINYHLFLDIEFSDASTYLNYIAQNINALRLNMFNPVTGVVGVEWDIFYLYQGYYHFASFFCWLINIMAFVFNRGSYVANITVITWGLGLIYSFFSTMFIVNIVNYFCENKKGFINIILIYLLLYANFYYWKIAFAFYGNTYRVIVGSILIFYIYRWFKEKDDNLKKMFPVIIFAGLSFTSSFLFISFVIMFALAVYLYMIKKDKTTYNMFTFVFPIALFGIIMFGKVYHSVLFAGILFLIIIYGGRLLKPVGRLFEEIDEFFFKHIKKIVFIIIPVLLAGYSLYLNLMTKGYVASYAHYFEDHQTYDMIKDYFFIYSNPIDNIFNVIRWSGIILFVLKAKSKEDQYVKNLVILTLLIFLNPLTSSAIAKFLTGIVYYRLIEVVFNPLMETILFILVLQQLEFKPFIKHIFIYTVLLCVVLGNVLSFYEHEYGLYSFYVKGGKNTTPYEKISQNELQAIFEVKKLVDENKDDNVVVISQTSALRTFIPNAYQLFSARDYYYDGYRVDEVLYQLARRHYSWDPWYLIKDTPYEHTCPLIYKYDVDYLLIEYWENADFDNFTNYCATTTFTGSNYKVKKVNK